MKVLKPVTVDSTVLQSSTVTPSSYDEWSSGSTYAAGDYVHVAADFTEYKSIQSGNLNKTPSTETTWWQNRGSNNTYRMFDTSPSTLTSATGTIDVVMAFTQDIINYLIVMGTTADTVRCTMTDPTDGLVYDMTVSLIEELVEPDWYEWFFTPIESKNTAIFKDIPPYLGADIQVTIEGGGTVSCGVCAAGYAFNIGRTNYGLKPGFTSYSVKTQDEFGNTTISVRGNSSLCDYPVEIDGTKFDYVSNMIRSLMNWCG
jgi:hypothetical protein